MPGPGPGRLCRGTGKGGRWFCDVPVIDTVIDTVIDKDLDSESESESNLTSRRKSDISLNSENIYRLPSREEYDRFSQKFSKKSHKSSRRKEKSNYSSNINEEDSILNKNLESSN